MIPIASLLEAHLTVEELQRHVKLYGEVLRLPLAGHCVDRRCACFWGGPKQQSILGLWEIGGAKELAQGSTPAGDWP